MSSSEIYSTKFKGHIVQISIYTNFGRVYGKTIEDIKISLNVSLKGSPKGVFPTKKLK